jgi:hypothetical protein
MNSNVQIILFIILGISVIIAIVLPLVNGSGPQGIQGIQGTTGACPDSCPPGKQGIQGIQGIPGTTGACPDSCPPGIQGKEGKEGIQGIQGKEGIQGIQGAGITKEDRKLFIKHGDKINMKSKDGLFLNNCGSDPNAPCAKTLGGTAHYVSTYDKDPEGNQWTISNQ